MQIYYDIMTALLSIRLPIASKYAVSRDIIIHYSSVVFSLDDRNFGLMKTERGLVNSTEKQQRVPWYLYKMEGQNMLRTYDVK